MQIFKFMYRQSKKGIGSAMIYALLLATIFSISIVIIVARGFNSIDSDEAIYEYNTELGCKIENYQLYCNKDYYLLDNFTIDLNEESERPVIIDGTLLTKDKIITSNTEITYKKLLTEFNYESSNFTFEDALDLLDTIKVFLIVVIFFIMVILSFVGHLIINLLRAIINKLLTNGFMKKDLNYDYMYKLTLYAVTPLVILNAFTRVIFDITLTRYLTSFIPFGSSFIKLALDSFIILGFTKLILSGKEDDVEKSVID